MTNHIQVTKKNEVHLKIETSPDIEQELSDYFSFLAPNYQYAPSYSGKKWDPRNKRYIFVPRVWDGKIRLFHKGHKTLYVGLLSYLQKFAEERAYNITCGLPSDEEFSTYEAEQFIKSLKLPHIPTPEQFKAFVLAVRKRRLLFLLPTGSGKSMLIYMLARYFNVKTLVVVPTTTLVHQMTNDFVSYGYDITNVHKIMQGMEKQTEAPIVISTWQSIYELPKEFFNQFKLIIGDEAHHFSADSLQTLMQKTVATPLKFGTTGTISDTKVHKLVLEGLFGPVRSLVKTRELIDRGFLADFKIKAITLAYSDATRRAMAGKPYKDEVEFIVGNQARMKFVRNLCLSLKGNTLVLFHLVDKHGKNLYNEINKVAGDRKVFFIYGGVDSQERNYIREIVETETDAIIIASYGTFSTGINIINLDNLVFATAFKSKIRTLQSIGRLLRKGARDNCTMIDIADDLSWRGKPNYSLKHFAKRVEIYAKEGFVYKLYKVAIND